MERRWRWALLVGWAAAVGWLTLRPAPVVDEEPMSWICVVCGDRGLADAVLNVVLFIPLGIGIAGFRPAITRPAAAALLAGFLVSTTIEAGQWLIPGRYPTLGDVVWNAAGAGAGALIWLTLLRRIRSPAPPDRALGAGLLAGVVVLTSGWLLAPTHTDADYWGQWTPDLGFMPQYDGTVVEASMNGMSLPPSRLAWPGGARSVLEGSWSLGASVSAGTPPPSVSPIVSVYDRDEVEILVFGADRDDLVLRERTRAKRLRLDQPDLRAPSALADVRTGDTLRLGASRAGGVRCLTRDAESWCDLGFTPGRGWALLYYPDSARPAQKGTLDAVWLALLFWPVGLTAVSRTSALRGFAVGMVLTTGAIPLTRLVPGPWYEWIAPAVGVALGVIAADLLGRWVGHLDRRPAGPLG